MVHVQWAADRGLGFTSNEYGARFSALSVNVMVVL
jgi:hypothetical protein